ncbi:PREDICTED: uncharacterized protein LOC106116007 isoform X2 [Papilio xuthus]|uniref:Uncharacterized protein LOC106116007 isoform X2 n=1 Tax=Papilio xuthus TaxID=66420 RepID=A0AAJ6Z4L1_PAPXU|nr:PREDICTED: uncharacterized protein LOC106116007 isoform X2 [Papilio xuthus]
MWVCHRMTRRIADLLPKMVDRNRTKCLEILSLCLNNVPSNEVISLFESREVSRLVQDGDSTALVLLGRGLSRLGRGLTGIGRGLVLQTEKHCRSDVKKVREAAYGVLRSAVECLFTDSLESNPKRSARFSSPLLQDEELKVALASLGIELMSDDKLRNSVSSCLPTSIATRFCESFIISVYLPVVYGNNKSVNCLTTFLDIFFKDLSDNEAFKRNLISDTMKNKLPTTSKDSNLIIHSSYQNEDLTTEETKTMDVLETLLQFSKTGEAASALTLTLLTSLSGTIRGLDFPAAMTQLLLPMLSQVGDITPFVIEACRLLVDECSSIPRFKPAVEELLKSVKGTEGEILLQVLLEDVDVRLSGIDYFVLGANKIDEDSEMMDLSKEFSLEDVVTAFDSLSNWQLLTLQQQKSTSDRLPPLWTCMSDFRKHLDSWQVTTTSTWFDKMLSIYQESKKSYKSLQWFNEMSRWPKRQFTISATIDALELKRMQDEEHPLDLKCRIQPQDCLVEWAARIMTRSACIQKMSENMESMTSISPSHSHALRWCARANEMALPLQVLRCIQTIDKQELATLAWQRQELLARRQLALKTSDMDILSLLLETAHSYESESRLIVDNTTIEDIIGLKNLILILRKDVGALSNEQLRCILYDTKDKIKTSESRVVGENKQMLKNMVQIAITHYDENWPLTGAKEQNIQLKEITNALGVGIDLNLDLDYSVLVDVLLYRLSCADQLDNNATDAVLGKMDTLIHVLDDFAIEELKRNQFKLTSPCELVTKLSRDTSKLKQCLQLVADPRHMLRHYVRELLKALENLDDAAWTKSFRRMKEKIFENPYAGVDYQVLIKYKEILYKISEFDLNNKDSIKESLLILLKELNSQSESFKLSQLCPALTQAEFLCGRKTEDCLSRLLMLPRGVHVHRFDEQVSVFTDSKRRPVVLSVRLSDGSRRRLLVKTGEELGVDAATLRVIRAMRLTTQDYQVTSLGDDSGLIEYLEDHERVREMISKKYDVKGIESLSTLGEKLIYDTREHSISQYQKMCAKIPAHAFRSVMELNSSSFQDFIYKKKNYEESLSAMTYATSLLGLKDRHLENILYDVVRGSVRSVDWNSALQHDQCEPPPARLTRCLLAPCRKQVLESRLQTLTSETRFYHRFLQATLQISFKWMENNIQDKLQTVYDLMRGTKLSHQVSQRSPGDFALLIDNIFKDFIYKDIYTIEEQVTNLLRHCTDPQILAITRSAWEPWI